jgi:Protein of unknown function (DUF2586)
VSEVPAVSVSVVQGGAPVLNSGILRTHVVIGYSSAGTLLPKEVTNATLVSTFVSGDAVKACARAVSRASAKAIFVRRTHTAVAATKTLTKTVVGTSVITATGTPTEAREFVFTVTSGGTIGTSNVGYTLSTDGGATSVSAVLTSPAATLAIGFGVTLNFTVGTLVIADVARVSTTDPSPAIVSLLKSGGGTLAPTASGTPVETIRARIEFLTAGVIGVDGITYRVSLDNGETWQSTASLGTATSIVVLDKRSDETTTPTGVTLALTATETVAVDTVITFRTTAPRVAIADVLAAISAAAASSYKQRGWKFYHIVGEYSASEMAQVQTRIDSLQASSQWNYAAMSFRDKRPYEVEADWVASIVADRATVNLNRIASYAGHCRNFTCPLTGRLDRRPAAWLDAVRRLCVDIDVESGRKKDGPLGAELLGNVGGEFSSGDITLYANGERVEFDSDADPLLADARISTLRTYAGEGAGVFITGSLLATGPDSKFKRTRDRELNDEASRALNTEGIRQILDSVRRNPGVYPVDAQPGDPGTIREADALSIESEGNTAVQNRIGPKANFIRLTVSRTDNLTGTVPRIIVETLDIEGKPVIEGVSATQIFGG